MTTLHESAVDRKLPSRARLISESLNELPRTSRYAFPSRQGLHSRSASFPQRTSKSPFFVRHNPHPKRVIHLRGLLDVPVCTVIDDNSHEDPARFLVKTPTIPTDDPRPRMRGLRMPLNANSFVTCREKAVPRIGLVPITQTWREELAKLTEAAGLKKRHPVISKTGLLQPPPSQQGDRPSTSRQAMNGDVPPSRNGEKPRTPNNEVSPPSRQASQQACDRPLEHIIAVTDNEGWVLETLCNILQTDSVNAVQSWLVNAPAREKELVLDMIRAISTSDYEFREGFNVAVRSPPLYEDQLLQHESSLDVDAINAYNESQKKKLKNEKNKQQDEKDEEPVEELQKPRTPASQNISKNEWTAAGCKPSSPFKPRPGTVEAEIEEIRSKLESRGSPRVFSHQSRVPPSRHSSRAPAQQSVYIPPANTMDAAAQRPPSHQSIKSQQNALKTILEYKPEKE